MRKHITDAIRKVTILGFSVMASFAAYAQPCNPGEDGCDIDTPLDSHVWVLMLFASVVALYALYNKRRAMP